MRAARAHRIVLLLALTLLAASACRDAFDPDVAVEARPLGADLRGGPTGTSHSFAVECLNRRGAVIPDHRVQWFVSHPITYAGFSPGPLPAHVFAASGATATMVVSEEGDLQVWAACERRDVSAIANWNWDVATVTSFGVSTYNDWFLR